MEFRAPILVNTRCSIAVHSPKFNENVGQKVIIFLQRSFCSVCFHKFRWTTLYLCFLERRVRGNGTKQDVFWKRRQNILDVYSRSTFYWRFLEICSVIRCYKTIWKRVNSFLFSLGCPPWLMQMEVQENWNAAWVASIAEDKKKELLKDKY